MLTKILRFSLCGHYDELAHYSSDGLSGLNVTNLVDILALLNLILSAAIVITSFSLLAYILIYNLRSSVARAFCALLACVMLVYLGDLLLFSVPDLAVAERWLRFQWLGIAFAPAAYLHFSDALLHTTNARSAWRYGVTRASYLLSGLFLVGAVWTDWVVTDGVLIQRAPHLRPGPAFWLYLLFFGSSLVWGGANLVWARRRCLTSTSRRRMTYLMASFVAPALGVFPYLLIISQPRPLLLDVFWLLMVAGNVGIGFMLVVMAYAVAYFGVLAPDRIVKHRLLHFLLRGPVVASLVVGAIILLVRVEAYLGLRRDVLAMVAVVATIVLSQLLIALFRPFLDRIVSWQDREELARIQKLSDHLLTTSDLKQFMENALSAVCDLLRVPVAFVVVPGADGPVLEAAVGPVGEDAGQCASSALVGVKDGAPFLTGAYGEWGVAHSVNGYLVWPLRAEAGDGDILGALAVSSPPSWDFSPEQAKTISSLIGPISAALKDRRLQQDVFAVVDRIIPELEVIQRQRGAVRYADSPASTLLAASHLDGPEFATWVRGALSHYWGGPQLADSPLLSLKVVERARAENEDNPIQALRTVLLRAIEQQRPHGERKMTAAEWLLYNILDLKFIQGYRVRDVATRLAMSEADLYRKQRVAIETVARALADMERQATSAGQVFPRPRSRGARDGAIPAESSKGL
ncbi:MAG: hypothetical protein JW850_16865 [Thermoflexales bacterium]|nr:hypothetical protein [Thermoflexales bacterium]